MRTTTAAALVGLVLFTAACSGGPAGPGVAQIGSAPTASPSSSLSPREAALAFSRCMRSHGITDFPDPDSGGGIAISAGPGSDLAPNNPLFQSAQRACQALMPKPSAAQQRQFMEQALKFAQCMRSHGITDFPDPQGNGGIVIQKGSGGGTSSSALDPNNPQFRAAQEACKGYLPGGGKGMGLSTHSGP